MKRIIVLLSLSLALRVFGVPWSKEIGLEHSRRIRSTDDEQSGELQLDTGDYPVEEKRDTIQQEAKKGWGGGGGGGGRGGGGGGGGNPGGGKGGGGGNAGGHHGCNGQNGCRGCQDSDSSDRDHSKGHGSRHNHGHSHGSHGHSHGSHERHSGGHDSHGSGNSRHGGNSHGCRGCHGSHEHRRMMGPMLREPFLLDTLRQSEPAHVPSI
ncbi:hypothetical protein HOLleu_27193 [Holothuria leucospilota]|uniref:Uncharacterized protein n=1 Tax=Holothuria leucospilota TaxID=206669 RepID=A0A9Q1BQH1_HOLLE|nr:hypothetical protein HOLleu_27193 [Holothuria leucospilota]